MTCFNPYSIKNYLVEASKGEIEGTVPLKIDGLNNDIDNGTAEDVWNTGNTYTTYTGFNPTAGEYIETLSSSANDAGTLVSSGTATGGSATTLVDTGATFVTDGVAVGDIILNDTQDSYGVVLEVTSETTLTVRAFCGDNCYIPIETSASDAYRVATTASTGAAVVQHKRLIESDGTGYYSEFIILNGTTGVDSVGDDYIRGSETFVLLSGSNGGAVGNIQSRQKTTTANVLTFVLAGENESQIAAVTIPKGKTWFILGHEARLARVNGSAGSCNVRFKMRRIGSNTFVTVEGKYISDGHGYQSPRGYVFAVPQMADVKWSVPDVSDNNTQVSAESAGLLIDN